MMFWKKRQRNASTALRRRCALQSLECRRLLTAEGETFNLTEMVDVSSLGNGLTATIDWGDGFTSNGSVIGGGSGNVTARIDYTYDTQNFFNTAEKRNIMQIAADAMVSRFEDQLAAISPSGNNSWSAVINHPGTGGVATISNLNIAANEVVIYVGGRNLAGNTLGQGGPGGHTIAGSASQSFKNTVMYRGQAGAANLPATDYGPWGGSLTFDTSNPWHFGATTAGLENDETDFLTVAMHEVGHLLGFGISDSWSNYVSGSNFTGPASSAEYDNSGAVPLATGNAHWSSTVREGGMRTLMGPSITDGIRVELTALDLAGFRDIGWSINASGGPGTVYGSHVYADNRSYNAAITVRDSAGASVTQNKVITVDNALPVLTVAGDQTITVNDTLSITDIGTITDSGFRNNSAIPPSDETFTYTIDWGDGSIVHTGSATIDALGSAGSPTRGSFDGLHTYGESGLYTVTVVVEDDDGGVATETFQVNVTDASSLSLSVDHDQFAENAGAGVATATLTRVNANTTAALTVTLHNDHPGEIAVPATVVIPAGSASTTFTINALDDDLLDGDQLVTLSASAAGVAGATTSLTVLDHETLTLAIADLVIAENAGANATTATVTRSNSDTAAKLTVTVLNSDATSVNAPTVVSIPAGEMSATFTLGALDNDQVDGTRLVTLTVLANGYESGQDSLTVTDHESLELSWAAAAFSENAGAQATAGTVSRASTAGDLVVTLYSSDESEAVVPAMVVIPNGQFSTTFDVAAVDDQLLDGTQAVSITASASGYTSAVSTLDVGDHEQLTVSLNVASIAENAGASAAVATLMRSNTDVAQKLTVLLATDDPSEASVPAAMSIPAGLQTVTVNVGAIDDDLLDGTQAVTLSVFASGYENGSAGFLVTDYETLSLTVANDTLTETDGDGETVATVTRNNTDLDVPLLVQLASLDTTELTVPAQVTIPAGEASVQFAVNAVDDGETDGVQIVGITASAAGYQPAEVLVQVSDTPAQSWQNSTDPLDVNGDGKVEPIDVLIVVNNINLSGSRMLPAPPADGEVPPYLDVNGDGSVSPHDALLVINSLNASPSGEGEAHDVAVILVVEELEQRRRPATHHCDLDSCKLHVTLASPAL